jgi:hypothetical protein
MKFKTVRCVTHIPEMRNACKIFVVKTEIRDHWKT